MVYIFAIKLLPKNIHVPSLWQRLACVDIALATVIAEPRHLYVRNYASPFTGLLTITIPQSEHITL